MPALTAGDVVNRIKAVMAVQGVQWNDATTRDRFKFGGPDTVVHGIATTFMGTFEAITRASERGLNMIIPHEDTYWNDPDNTLIAQADPLIYQKKIDFMTEHGIVIFRIHDHMHRQRPDFTFSGTAREVGLDLSMETAPNGLTTRPRFSRSCDDSENEAPNDTSPVAVVAPLAASIEKVGTR